MWKEDKLSFDQVYGTYEFPDRKGVLNWSIYRSGHFSIARAFGIGLPLAAQLRRGHWNRPAAARTSRPSPGMAGICMHVHPGRGHAARPATSRFQRPLRGNPMPNAFHPRRRLTTLWELHRLLTAAEEAPRHPHALFWSVSTGSISSICTVTHSHTHTLTYPTWGKQRITRPTHTGIID